MGFFGFGKKQAMPTAPGGIETGGVATNAPLPPTTVEAQGAMPASGALTQDVKPSSNLGPSILPVGANTASTEAWHATKLESMGTPAVPTHAVTETPAPAVVPSAEVAATPPPVIETTNTEAAPPETVIPAAEPAVEVAPPPATTAETPVAVEPKAVMPGAERVLSPEDEEAWANQQKDKEPEVAAQSPAQTAADPQPDILANIGHIETPAANANPAGVTATPIVGGMEQPQGGNVLDQVTDVVNKIPDSPLEQAEAVADAAGGLPTADAVPPVPATPEPAAA